MLGKVIAKGPKWGRIFPLQINTIRNKPTCSESAFLSVSSQNNWRLWHNRLGHPNPKTLLSLFRSGLVNKNIVFSRADVVEYFACKLGKSKTLPFPLHDNVP